ncbi:PQQ-dependent sugar dehydrogenase [Microvirga sp. VF16]|uniref:PQQ-dependent sugar dehydrogenase n=1 Tax=Microvirga sp. VF16 TaxID=2807101 RepID=UPI00193D3F5D|nr:PQQ-dependent sugar dehydrogenase [Microvirga sp. VF16]QRM29538.1 PQQ-dependent sugar dehydrogenase [Microvirga sp. VF16]
MVSKTTINGDNTSNVLRGTDAADVIYGFTAHSQATSIQATKLASYTLESLELPRPLVIASTPNDPDHLFIADHTGIVKVLDLNSNQTLTSPFLDLTAEVATAGEQGLLGFVFDPNHAENGYVYLYMSTRSKDVEIRRYTVAADNPLKIDPDSKHVVKKIDFPDSGSGIRHRGGWIGFGPDGYLYVSIGDAENGANAQRLDNPFGKVLRLDVSGDGFPGDPGRNYIAPSDNPTAIAGIAGDASGTGIYAAGLRNPWKGSFDRATGDLYVSDVGQATAEEINWIKAGANYGWSQTEGTFDPAAYPFYTNPIHAYGRSIGTVIVGGYVYRGQEDAFHGQYFFSDLYNSKVWTMNVAGPDRSVTDVTADVRNDLENYRNPGVYGEDALGNLYLAMFGGDIIRLSPQTTSLDQADTLDGAGGNDVIYAGAGNDNVLGGSGNDELNGMAGNDSLDGGIGQDRMIGGRGDDIYVIDNAKDVVLERTGEGQDTIRTKVSFALADTMSVEILWTTNTSGTAAIDLTGNKLDNKISGNASGNVLTGLGGKDLIRGLAGGDTIAGGSNDDDLHGDGGDDHIEGNAGDDKLEGGSGIDRLTGGSGADTFAWLSTGGTGSSASSADIMLDFDRTEGDRLNLVKIDAREDRDGAQAFTFVGTAEFTRSGQVRFGVDGEQTLIFLNTDADGEAEAVICLAGRHDVKADWFLL